MNRNTVSGLLMLTLITGMGIPLLWTVPIELYKMRFITLVSVLSVTAMLWYGALLLLNLKLQSLRHCLIFTSSLGGFALVVFLLPSISLDIVQLRILLTLSLLTAATLVSIPILDSDEDERKEEKKLH